MPGGTDYSRSLLKNILEGIIVPKDDPQFQLVKGTFEYYHYGCDGLDDRGWGCGYRTLMSLCSSVRAQLMLKETEFKYPSVPSISTIQQILVEIGDKPEEFIGSKEWIGCIEASMIIDTLFDTPSKIIHLKSGKEMASHSESLLNHFKKNPSPIMMGGDVDNSAKLVAGIAIKDDRTELLIVDPHYWGEPHNGNILKEKGWIKWIDISTLDDTSFYNLCLPQP